VMAEVPIRSLRLDPRNPRIQFELEARGEGTNPAQEVLKNLLWESPETKKLKRSIEENGGLLEAIIISGKDGTVIEGNRRLDCYFMLLEETGDEETWGKIRARILPPEVTRSTIDELLGELHIAGKNEWTPFEQANHLSKMVDKGFDQGDLAKAYR